MLSDIPRLMEERNIDSLVVLGNQLYPDDPFWRYVLGGEYLDSGIFVWNRGQKPILVVSEEFSGSAAKRATRATKAEFIPSSNFADIREEVRKEEKDELMKYVKYYAQVFRKLGVEGKVSIYGSIVASGDFYIWKKLESFMKRQSPNFEFIPEAFLYQGSIISHARMTKDKREVKLIKDIGKRANEVVTQVIDWLRNKKLMRGKVYDKNLPVTIGNVKDKIRMECLKRKLEDSSFPTIFSMGKESAEFHNRGTDKVELRSGETIIFDFFPRDLSSRYFWDMTRTFVIGKISSEIKKIYEDVLQVQQEIIDFLRPGVPLTEIERKACKLFEQKGYLTYRSPENKPRFKEGYGHVIGHGIGLAEIGRAHV